MSNMYGFITQGYYTLTISYTYKKKREKKEKDQQFHEKDHISIIGKVIKYYHDSLKMKNYKTLLFVHNKILLLLGIDQVIVWRSVFD